MLSFFYDSVLILYAICMLPKFLWEYCWQGKYRKSLKQRFGFDLPYVQLENGQQLLWIHAISMGETRAVIPLFHLLKERFPNLAIVISSTTETGHAEAKRCMPEAKAHFFLPLDFSWNIKKCIKHLNPSYLMLVESDLWYHLLFHAKQHGACVFLVNGKISERSSDRFAKIPAFTRHLFAPFDLLCVQSALYLQRFLHLGVPQDKLYATGNIKLDAVPKILKPEEKKALKEELGLVDTDRIIVIASSHDPEEEWILDALQAVWTRIPNLKVILVPRHPERFVRVEELLKQKNIDALIYSKRAHKRGGESVILIDAMGLLNSCYQISEIAIVAGSFVSHVGGHNIFEPILYHVPVLFGPHMHNQPDFEQLVLNAQAGKQLSVQELSAVLFDWLENPDVLHTYSLACKTLCKEVQGSSRRTFDRLLPYFIQ